MHTVQQDQESEDRNIYLFHVFEVPPPYPVKLFGGPINWKSRKQITVTSTTEAELLAPSRRDYLTLLVLNLTAIFLSLAITNELSIP